MVGGLMALNALSIDIMLPALGVTGEALGAPGNERQLIITAYLFGFGAAQLLFGPLADSLGRRRTLLGALIAYLAATALCIMAPDMTLMVIARFLQGVAAAATRVVAIALVRDLVSGRRMAEIMSFALTVFMIAPILAPGLGQLILFVAPWQAIFGALFVMSAGLTVWMALRLPETLRPEYRISLNPASAWRNYVLAASHRMTLGYMTASSLIFGALFAFIASSEQVMAELYGLGAWFPVAFGAVALGLAGANIVNARIVRRLGMRRISHAALAGFTAVNLIHLAIALMMHPPFWLYYALLTLALMLFAMVGANFSALAMEPAGERAGTTAALYGAVTSMSGAVLGALIGLAYDGTVAPLILGFVVMGVLAIAVVIWTERGVMFGAGEPYGDEES
ncbi:multidrug effflux MFS transporter [Alkalicaulis satelles]|uniref:Bcr/CflA family efflux transporter n=2 Tax=Alkalicaulis satelles TaxID=2609175 RepID=A0A5M6ZKX1_9PROT|nr:multidrug effflux MFS transporter [Alkalicaulis satelles]